MVHSGFTTIQAPTRSGVVYLLGRFEGFRTDRPLVVAIPGALQAPDYLFALAPLIPQADVVIALLPGMFAPLHRPVSVQTFAQAFDEAISAQFPDRRILRLGFSVGGLVAMAMRTGQAFAAVDSPLTTETLWPLFEPLRAEIARGDNARIEEWAWAILGVGPTVIENRDYRPLLAALETPGLYVIAGEPLEPMRVTPRIPGAMTEADRDLVSAHPGVTTLVVPGCGHDVLGAAPRAVQLAAERGLGLLGGGRSGR